MIYKTIINQPSSTVVFSTYASHLVNADWQSTGHCGRELSIGIRGVVQALEELEVPGIGEVGRSDRGDCLDHDVTVADRNAVSVHLLGRRVVRHRGVGKVARVKVYNSLVKRSIGARTAK